VGALEISDVGYDYITIVITAKHEHTVDGEQSGLVSQPLG